MDRNRHWLACNDNDDSRCARSSKRTRPREAALGSSICEVVLRATYLPNEITTYQVSNRPLWGPVGDGGRGLVVGTAGSLVSTSRILFRPWFRVCHVAGDRPLFLETDLLTLYLPGTFSFNLFYLRCIIWKLWGNRFLYRAMPEVEGVLGNNGTRRRAELDEAHYFPKRLTTRSHCPT